VRQPRKTAAADRGGPCWNAVKGLYGAQLKVSYDSVLRVGPPGPALFCYLGLFAIWVCPKPIAAEPIQMARPDGCDIRPSNATRAMTEHEPAERGSKGRFKSDFDAGHDLPNTWFH